MKTKRPLDLATNLFGPLSPDCRERIQRLLDAPSDETWNGAYSIILNGKAPMSGVRTLWQAVIAVDSTFPCVGPTSSREGRRTPWERVPDALTVARAIRRAVGA